MDVDEVYLDLLTLRQLYILLLKSCLQDANSQLQLDERAQILLKHLLDDATAGVLEFHSSKILATESSSIFDNLPSSQTHRSLKQLNVVDRPSVISDNEVTTFTSHQDVSSSHTGIGDKQRKPLDEKVAAWMELNQPAGKMGYLVTEDDNPSMTRAVSASNDATNDLSNGISLALRRIEFHILSLKRCTSPSRITRSHINGAELANSPLNQQKVQPTTDQSSFKTRFTEPIKGHYLRSHVRSHPLGGQKVRPMVTGAESLIPVCRQTKDCSEFVHGFRIPLRQVDDEARKSPAIETQIPRQNKLTNTMILMDKSGKLVERPKWSFPPACSVGSKSKAATMSSRKLNHSRIQERFHNSADRVIMRPTLLDHPSRGKETHKKSHVSTLQESEDANSESESESASSSSWATQQTSETNEYPSSSPSLQQGPPSTGSDESSWYRSSVSTLSSHYNRNAKPPHTVASTKTVRFHHETGSKKAIGRFKRLKNKLGLIFHHHHHHHHHHNSDNFMWKRLRKIFHRTEQKKVISKGGGHNKQLKKSVIRTVSGRNQAGRFQALAEGFRSHVWKSKAMKRKEVAKVSRRKNDVKKLQWWQMFRRHRGVKLPNKGRVKIGYGKWKQK